MQTLYQKAGELIRFIVDDLLYLSENTNNFNTVTEENFNNKRHALLLLGGIGAIPTENANDNFNTWLSRSSIGFDLEISTKSVVYSEIEPFVQDMVSFAYQKTNNFSSITSNFVENNSYLIPVIMHSLGIFSKRDFQKRIGVTQVSDTKVSAPTAIKIANLFDKLENSQIASQEEVVQRMRGTTEGIVRDLVGRVLLEDFVAASLTKEKINFLREDEYTGIKGVIYDFRADFLIGDENNPIAFIEVRKSSAGHASLYAKDKMFSAINWKGQHKKCVAVLITDGPWTRQTLEIMATVFDYVVPIQKVNIVSNALRRYVDGDDSVLNWIIDFKINKN